jgi:acyl carrier protein
MDDEELQSKMVKHARDVFEDPSVTYAGDRFFRDILGFDSVRAVHYILAMEQAVGVTLNEDEVDQMHTMGDMLAILRSKTSASQIAEGA